MFMFLFVLCIFCFFVITVVLLSLLHLHSKVDNKTIQQKEEELTQSKWQKKIATLSEKLVNKKTVVNNLQYEGLFS